MLRFREKRFKTVTSVSTERVPIIGINNTPAFSVQSPCTTSRKICLNTVSGQPSSCQHMLLPSRRDSSKSAFSSGKSSVKVTNRFPKVFCDKKLYYYIELIGFYHNSNIFRKST